VGQFQKKAKQFYGGELSHFFAKYLISLTPSSPARGASQLSLITSSVRESARAATARNPRI
jgi:hypothetical protein